MAGLIWIHEEALRPSHPVFSSAPDFQAVFCWDADYMRRADIGQKRQLFIYECLLELDLEIYQGLASEVLPALADQRAITEIIVPDTPSPILLAEFAAVQSALPSLTLRRVADHPFVTPSADPDLGRFFRYWNKVRKPAMRHGGV
jgi:hypothetical protein